MESKKILMIDDDTDYTGITKIYLEEAGNFDVCVVNRGVEGYPAAKQIHPDIILLDISMPDVSGLQVADELAKDPELNRIPIVFFTGFYEGHEVDADGKTIKGHPFLAKPTTGEALLSFIQKSLGS